MQIVMIELYGVGGTADYTACLAEAVTAAGHAVTLVTSSPFQPFDNRPQFRVAKIVRYWPDQPRPVKALLLAAGLRQLRGVVEGARPDIIHVQGTVIPALERHVYAGLKGMPRICTVHDVLSHEPRPWLGSFERFYQTFDWLICHSKASRRHLNQLGLKKGVSIIPHGTYDGLVNPAEGREEARIRLGLRAEDHVVLMFGYLRRYKGLDNLLAAARLTRELGRPVKVLVVGHPLYDISGSIRRARDWGLDVTWNLEFIPRQGVAVYFAAADVIALPYNETSDSGAFELAASYRKPVVVTAVGGLPEAFERYGFGAIVAPGDTRSLAEALMAQYPAAVWQARGNSWAEIAAQTEDVYARLLHDTAVRTKRVGGFRFNHE